MLLVCIEDVRKHAMYLINFVPHTPRASLFNEIR